MTSYPVKLNESSERLLGNFETLEAAQAFIRNNKDLVLKDHSCLTLYKRDSVEEKIFEFSSPDHLESLSESSSNGDVPLKADTPSSPAAINRPMVGVTETIGSLNSNQLSPVIIDYTQSIARGNAVLGS